MASVVLDRVTKVYPGNRVAVEDLSLTVADTEFVVIVGPSGCGKTTTLRLVAGLEEASAGTVRIGGREVGRVAPSDRGVAMVFQSHLLYPHLTVYENLAFGLRLGRRPERLDRREVDQRVRGVATALGIDGLLGHRPGALSGGERQRVAVGRALARKPDVFLLDEPLAHLDGPLRQQMRREFRELHRQFGGTFLYVTHDQAEAMALGDRLVVLRAGVVQQIGTAEQLYDQPKNRFVAGFLGAPPMNFLAGRIVEREGEYGFGMEAGELPLSNEKARAANRPGRLWLGIRPEHMRIDRAPAGDARLRGTVVAMENLGHERIVRVSLGEQEVSCRVAPGGPIEQGQLVELAVAMDRVHLFDENSGENLTRMAAGPVPGG